MFDIGWGKLVIIAVIALVVIGPKELPAVLRTLGQWMTKIRRMAAEFQGQFQEAMREAEMADLKKHVDSLHETTSNLGSGFDPLESTRKDIEALMEEKPGSGSPSPSALAPGDAPKPADASAASTTGEGPAPAEAHVAPKQPAPASNEVAGSAGLAPAAPASDAGGRSG
jgi:sec-independent protein translocase protein TatB